MNVYPYPGVDTVLVVLFRSGNGVGRCFAFFIFNRYGVWSQALDFSVSLSVLQLILFVKVINYF